MTVQETPKTKKTNPTVWVIVAILLILICCILVALVLGGSYFSSGGQANLIMEYRHCLFCHTGQVVTDAYLPPLQR